MTFFYALNKKLADLAAKPQPQTLNEGREQVYREYKGDVQEKWDTETKVSPAEKGKYQGKTKAELQKQYNALKARGPHKKGSPDFGKMRELAFAIRAKSGWGKVTEGDIDPNRHPQTRDYGTGEPLDDEGRQRDRRELAKDVDVLDRLERQALKRGAQVDEADFEEGNEFSGELAQARAAGKKEFEVDGKTYPVKEAAKKEKTPWPGSAEYKEKFGQDRETFRKKHAPSVMKDPKGREELARLDTEYEAGKKSYGRDEEGDDEEGDKKAAPTGEKRGRGRPKGSKRAIGAKGPSGKSKLLTREQVKEVPTPVFGSGAFRGPVKDEGPFQSKFEPKFPTAKRVEVANLLRDPKLEDQHYERMEAPYVDRNQNVVNGIQAGKWQGEPIVFEWHDYTYLGYNIAVTDPRYFREFLKLVQKLGSKSVYVTPARTSSAARQDLQPQTAPTASDGRSRGYDYDQWVGEGVSEGSGDTHLQRLEYDVQQLADMGDYDAAEEHAALAPTADLKAHLRKIIRKAMMSPKSNDQSALKKNTRPSGLSVKQYVKQQMNRQYGKGNITFDRDHAGGYNVHHTDDADEIQSHQYDPKTGKVDFRSVVSATEYYEGAKWRDPDRQGQTWARDDASDPDDPRPGKIPLTRTGQPDVNTYADKGKGTASDPLAWKASQQKAAGKLTPDDVRFGVKKNFPIYDKSGVSEDYDRDEYDEEGEMAQSQARTIENAAEELQSILDADENLPEWVQKKISLAQEYIDSARDYLKANRPGDEIMAEKAVSKAQRAAAGIARAAQKGEIPRSELRGASKEMARMEPKELRKFAKTKEKGLPEKVGEGEAEDNKAERAGKKVTKDIEYDEKVKDKIHGSRRGAEDDKAERAGKKVTKDIEYDEKVDETTTAGSVATAPSVGGKKSKGGMQFGKGIYDSMNREVEAMISESMNVSINMNTDAHGGPSKSVTVTATDEDAEKLASLLRMAGLGQGGDSMNGPSTCPSCSKAPCGCSEQVDENKPDWPTETETSDDALQYSGGLNKPKATGQTTVPVIASQDDRQHAYEGDDELRRLRERAGIFAEAKKKPDFPDLDKDGDKTEPMSKAIKDKESKVDEAIQGSLWNLYKRLQ